MHFDREIKGMMGRTWRVGLAEEKEREKARVQDEGFHVGAFWPLCLTLRYSRVEDSVFSLSFPPLVTSQEV